MEFVVNGAVVRIEQPQESKICPHEIIRRTINGTIYRYCKHCGMIAHADGSFAYCCGSEYCRCMQ